MRNHPPFACPQCGNTSPVGTQCPRCEAEMVDTHGVAALRRPRADLQVSEDDFEYLMASNLVGALVVGVGRALAHTTHAVSRASDDRRHHARLRAEVESAGPVQFIASAHAGPCHVRGHVVVLGPVAAPDDEEQAGAYLVRAMRSEKVVRLVRTSMLTYEKEWEMWPTFLTEYADCGRFAVVDDTGVALVDDDVFELGRLDGEVLSRWSPGRAVVREGAIVEVVGPAAWGPARDVAGIAQTGALRGDTTALIFNGAPDHPVVILV